MKNKKIKEKKTFFLKIKTKTKATSIIELLIVIAIIGILVSIGIIAFKSPLAKARDNKRKTEIEQLKRSLEMYYNDYGNYPHSSNGKIVLGETTINWGEIFKDEKGTIYMKKLPKETKGPDLCYKTTEDNQKHAIFSILENENDSQYNYYCPDKSYSYFICDNYYNYVVMSQGTSIEDFGVICKKKEELIIPTESISTPTPTLIPTPTSTPIPISTPTPTREGCWGVNGHCDAQCRFSQVNKISAYKIISVPGSWRHPINPIYGCMGQEYFIPIYENINNQWDQICVGNIIGYSSAYWAPFFDYCGCSQDGSGSCYSLSDQVIGRGYPREDYYYQKRTNPYRCLDVKVGAYELVNCVWNPTEGTHKVFQPVEIWVGGGSCNTNGIGNCYKLINLTQSYYRNSQGDPDCPREEPIEGSESYLQCTWYLQ